MSKYRINRPSEKQVSEDSKKRNVLKEIPKQKEVLMLLFIAVGFFMSTIYFYQQYQTTQRQLHSSTGEVQTLLKKLGALMLLPNENPTVATVTDKNKVRRQEFFAHAENGDKLFIFAKARKAILYRPSENKIIEISSINLGKTQVAGVNDTPITPTKSKPAKVIMYPTYTPRP